MPHRMTRTQSQSQTRERLLASAHELFRRDGYGATSLDRIAEEAGYSKGAVYSNFAGKEDIFLEVLDAQGRDGLAGVTVQLAKAEDDDAVVECLAHWADTRSRSGNWALTILEHARLGDGHAASVERQAQIIRAHWRHLGDAMLERYPDLAGDPQTLGALLHEIAYAPAITLVERPTAGDLMRLAVRALLAGWAKEGATASTRALRRRTDVP